MIQGQRLNWLALGCFISELVQIGLIVVSLILLSRGQGAIEAALESLKNS